MVVPIHTIRRSDQSPSNEVSAVGHEVRPLSRSVKVVKLNCRNHQSCREDIISWSEGQFLPLISKVLSLQAL